MEIQEGKYIIPVIIHENGVHAHLEKGYIHRVFRFFIELNKSINDLPMYKDYVSFDIDKIEYKVTRNKKVRKIINFLITAEEFKIIKGLIMLNNDNYKKFIFTITYESLHI